MYAQTYISTYHVMCQNTSAHDIILGMAVVVFCKVAKCIAPQKTNAIALVQFEMGYQGMGNLNVMYHWHLGISGVFLKGEYKIRSELQLFLVHHHHHCPPHYPPKHQQPSRHDFWFVIPEPMSLAVPLHSSFELSSTFLFKRFPTTHVICHKGLIHDCFCICLCLCHRHHCCWSGRCHVAVLRKTVENPKRRMPIPPKGRLNCQTNVARLTNSLGLIGPEDNSCHRARHCSYSWSSNVEQACFLSSATAKACSTCSKLLKKVPTAAWLPTQRQQKACGHKIWIVVVIVIVYYIIIVILSSSSSSSQAPSGDLWPLQHCCHLL